MTVSVSSLTQKVYEIPATLDDSPAIEQFLYRNRGKKVVVVQGLGFVGAVMSIVCANAFTEDYAVIGVDLPNEKTYWKIKSINEGIFPIVADDPKIGELFDHCREQDNFFATYDPSAYKYADVIVVDINLDVMKKSGDVGELVDFDVDLSGFKAAIESIGKNCRDDVLILVETTVPPGTCEKIVRPIIEEQLCQRKLAITKFKLGHSYERVMPGPRYIESIREFPRVYAGCDLDSADAVEAFLNTIIDTSVCNLTRLEHTNATEMCKVLENSYRAMNIAFSVEWSRFAEEAGVDLYAMVDAIRERATHANLMYPGLGVGGYCLTKDPLLASWARRSLFGSQSHLNMSVNGVSTNDQMPGFAFDRLRETFGVLAGKKVVFLGVSYRGDVGDTRFTPVEPLFLKVIQSGATVLLHDPFVAYWDEQNLEVCGDFSGILDFAPDLIIIAAGHSEYKHENTTKMLMSLSSSVVYDTIGLLSRNQIDILSDKHKIIVLGRGDL